LGLYFSLLFTAWVQIGQLWKKTTQPLIKADCMALQAGLALTFLLMIYSDSQVNLFVHEIMVAVMLGYAAFIHREQRVSTYSDTQKAS
jgi:hypothetical protein